MTGEGESEQGTLAGGGGLTEDVLMNACEASHRMEEMRASSTWALQSSRKKIGESRSESKKLEGREEGTKTMCGGGALRE